MEVDAPTVDGEGPTGMDWGDRNRAGAGVDTGGPTKGVCGSWSVGIHRLGSLVGVGAWL